MSPNASADNLVPMFELDADAILRIAEARSRVGLPRIRVIGASDCDSPMWFNRVGVEVHSWVEDPLDPLVIAAVVVNSETWNEVHDRLIRDRFLIDKVCLKNAVIEQTYEARPD